MKRFLVLFLSLCLVICLSACGSTATVGTQQSTESSDAEIKAFKIGEEIFINTDEGEYKLTITDVKETAERNEFSEKTPERVIVISYSYENISQDDDLFISDMNFKAYDKDNNAMDTYPVGVKDPDSISTGRKATGQMAYGLDSSENYVELEFYDNYFLDSDCKIILEW